MILMQKQWNILFISLLLFLFSGFYSTVSAGRNGPLHNRNDEDNERSTSIARSTEEEMRHIMDDTYDLLPEELEEDGKNSRESRDDGWNKKADVICVKGGLCSCTETTPLKINCRGSKLKNGRLLDTAFLAMPKNAQFGAQIVDLSYNEIQLLRKDYILPKEASTVLILDVSHNWLSDVEAYAFESFDKLVSLKLSNNRLGDQELSYDWLTKKLGETLHQLYLDYNYFEQIDDGIFDNLINLRKLVLDGNFGIQLTQYTFRDTLTQLKTISLDNCGIETLDEDVFKRLPNLEQLSLAGNRIGELVPALRNIPKLSVLSMSETKLTELPKNAFKYNLQLKSVYLRNMRSLKRVVSCAFCGLEKLEVIDLSGSSVLSFIDENAFGGNSDKEVLPSNVAELYVSNCNLTTVGARLLDWHALRKFGANGNLWRCDCALFWLLGNSRLHKFVQEEPNCASPAVLKGVPLRDVWQNMSCIGVDVAAHNANENASGGILSGVGIAMLLAVVASVFIISGLTMIRREGSARAVIQRVRNALPSGGNDNRHVPLGYANLDRGSAPINGADGAVIVGANVNDYGVETDTARLDEDFNRPEFV